jgi:hypothetical protein
LQKAPFMKPINIYFVVSFLYFYRWYPLFAWPVIPTCSQIFPVLSLTSFCGTSMVSRFVDGLLISLYLVYRVYPATYRPATTLTYVILFSCYFGCFLVINSNSSNKQRILSFTLASVSFLYALFYCSKEIFHNNQ